MDRVRAEDDWKPELAALDQGCLAVDDQKPVVACGGGLSNRPRSDRQGFTLDRLKLLLAEWGFDQMLINAGGSSLWESGDRGNCACWVIPSDP